MKNKVCNSVHKFLNLKFFNKYGTILLIAILVVILASLMDFNLGINFSKKIERPLVSNNNFVEGFTTTYSFPDLYYLKQDIFGTDNNKYVYVRPNTQYISSSILNLEMRRSPYRVFSTTTGSTSAGSTTTLTIRIPIFIREFLNRLDNSNLTLNSTQRTNLTTNEYIEFELVDLINERNSSPITHNSVDRFSSFKLRLSNPTVEQGSQPVYLILNTDRTISLVQNTPTTTGTGSTQNPSTSMIERQGRFMLKSRSEIENEQFNPIVPNTLKIKIHPEQNELDVDFNVDPNIPNIDHFLLILAKYDYKRNLLGHLKVHTSQENSASNKNMCIMDRGIKKCHYKLTDIDHIDENGHILYYRLGVIPIDEQGNSGRYLEPNYPGGHTHFVMSKSEKEMEKIIRKIQEMEKTETQRDRLNEQIISGAGGEYEFLKKQLGNYPSNLILDTNHNTLRELVNKSMSLGEINLDITNI